MAETLSVRIPAAQVKAIRYLSTLSHRNKSETLREIVEVGIQNKKLELAINKFRNKEATAWKAARIAGVPLTSFLDVLKERNVLFHYSTEELEQEFKGLV